MVRIPHFGSAEPTARRRGSGSVRFETPGSAWRTISTRVGLEQFHEISGRVLQQDLLAGHALDYFAAEATAG
jgi:hypothetical protein